MSALWFALKNAQPLLSPGVLIGNVGLEVKVQRDDTLLQGGVCL